MNLTEKIKVLLAYRNMNMRQLAKAMNISQQSLSQRMQRGNFKEDELIQIAEICNATFEGVFTLNVEEHTPCHKGGIARAWPG